MGDLSRAEIHSLCPDATAAECDRWRGQLAEYGRLLSHWGHRVNLVAEGDLPYLGARHLAPALSLRPLLRSLPHHRVLDVGSGGGLPAIPLKIALPEMALTLVEGRRRRCSFLREVVRSLGLRDVRVLNQRLEMGPGEGGGHALATLRAVAVTPELVGSLRPWLVPGSFLVSTLPATDDGSGPAGRLFQRDAVAPAAPGAARGPRLGLWRV